MSGLRPAIALRVILIFKRRLILIALGFIALTALNTWVQPGLTADKGAQFAVLVQRAGDLYNHKHFRAVIATCNEILRIQPNFAYAYDLRGISQVELSEARKGLIDLNRAIQLDPKVYLTYRNRAFAKIELRDTQGAIDDLAAAQKCPVKPDFATEVPNNLRLRAELLSDLHRYKEAAVDYERAIKLDPKAVDNWTSRGHMYVSMGQFQKAVDDYSMAIKLNPKELRSYGYRAVAYKKMGMRDKAEQDLKMTNQGALDF